LSLSHNAHEVYIYDRDLFLRALFVPVAEREKLLTLYALIVELEKIPAAVSEEMIGHIKYAWWHENALGGRSGHPVLEAITSFQLSPDTILSVIEAYRDAYPQPPVDRAKMLETASLALINTPKRWLKAHRIINNHRKRYQKRFYAWLVMKLLTHSLF
jgi:phytoene/squalene synthetase